jgi:hypothetical protein
MEPMIRSEVACSAHPVAAHAVAACAGDLIERGVSPGGVLVVVATPSFLGALGDIAGALGRLLGARSVAAATAGVIVAGGRALPPAAGLAVMSLNGLRATVRALTPADRTQEGTGTGEVAAFEAAAGAAAAGAAAAFEDAAGGVAGGADPGAWSGEPVPGGITLALAAPGAALPRSGRVVGGTPWAGAGSSGPSALGWGAPFLLDGAPAPDGVAVEIPASLEVGSLTTSGAVPVGPAMTVTEAGPGVVIRSVGGRPAGAWVASAAASLAPGLRGEVGPDAVGDRVEIGLVVGPPGGGPPDAGSPMLGISLAGHELRAAAPVAVGTQVRLGVRSTVTCRSGTALALDRLAPAGAPVGAVVAVVDVARPGWSQAASGLATPAEADALRGADGSAAALAVGCSRVVGAGGSALPPGALGLLVLGRPW